MIKPYFVFKNIIPTTVRTFIRDLDSAYQQRLKEIEVKNQQIQDLEQNYTNLQSSYQTLQASYEQLMLEQHHVQSVSQEITKLYQILSSSHQRLLGYSNKTIQVITEKPIAYDSPDHIEPWGTKHDNSINLNFNYKLAKWIPLKDLTVLDLGCSGGGFVKSIIDLGCFAVGIEGSDYSKIIGRAEWSTIPSNLFTADVTEPFKILVNSEDEEINHSFEFTVITAWEFIEHISADKLPIVFQNISSHLIKSGIVIMSVSPNEDVINGVRLHQTVENKEWWLAECYRNGFIHHEEVVKYFDKDFVRGEPNAPNSFHLILTRTGESLPLFNFNR
ncbi:MAG: methyltransferase domain-containing protein [Nostoc sp.]|uniref:class I SAM-dependent methyltransferase n=1 Tax=Nostoc sp. TaxID=1180 RepID=UPI002FFD1D6A